MNYLWQTIPTQLQVFSKLDMRLLISYVYKVFTHITFSHTGNRHDDEDILVIKMAP